MSGSSWKPFPPAARGHSGLPSEPPAEIVRIRKTEPHRGFGNRPFPCQFLFGSREHPACAPLSEGESRRAAHETVEVILLQADAPRQFSWCGKGFPRGHGAQEFFYGGRSRTRLRSGAQAGSPAGLQKVKGCSPGPQFKFARSCHTLPALVGKSVELLPHRCKILRREPSRGPAETDGATPAQIGNQTDRQPGGMLGEGVLRSGRDKEDRSRRDRIARPIDPLGAFPS